MTQPTSPTPEPVISEAAETAARTIKVKTIQNKGWLLPVSEISKPIQLAIDAATAQLTEEVRRLREDKARLLQIIKQQRDARKNRNRAALDQTKTTNEQ